MKNTFWRDERYPYIEIRRTEESPESYKPHAHEDFLSVGCVEKGEVVMQTADYDTLSAGMLVFFNPMELHSCNPPEGTFRTYSMMHLKTDWCLEVQSSIFSDVSVFLPLNTNSLKDEKLFNEYISVTEAFLEGYEEAEDELLKFVSDIFSAFCHAEESEDIQSPLLKEISDYLKENLFENISLDELADRFRQNRYNLLRSFKNAYGFPPHSYQMNIRVERAKEMLRKGWDIADVAARAGFTDQSHFHRVFKKHTAATPGQYKSGQ